MENELKHHGILGMKWGVRRYQPYDTTGPRKGGKTGKEIGEAREVQPREDRARSSSNYSGSNGNSFKSGAKKAIKVGTAIVAGLALGSVALDAALPYSSMSSAWRKKLRYIMTGPAPIVRNTFTTSVNGQSLGTTTLEYTLRNR